MKRTYFLIFVLCLFGSAVGAQIPWVKDSVFIVNGKADNLVDGFYSKIEAIEETKAVVEEFEQIVYENSGMRPRKDLRDFGFLGFSDKSGSFRVLGYLTGKFEPAKIISEVEALASVIPPAAKLKVDVSSQGDFKIVGIEGKKKNKKFCFYFYNNRTVVFGSKKDIDWASKGELSFSDAPLAVAKATGKTSFYAWLDTGKLKATIEKSGSKGAKMVAGMLAMFNTAQVEMEKDDFALSFNCADGETAKNLKTFIEGQIAGYRLYVENSLKSATKPGNGPGWLPKAFSFLLTKSSALMAKKSLDATSVVTLENLVTLKTKVPSFAGTILSPATLGAVGVVAAIAIPNFNKARGKAQQKACFANQRVLMGAVEMYNMDNEGKMTELNEKNLELLVKEKYILKLPECPQNGSYKSIGDLSKDGIINCTKHGAVK